MASSGAKILGDLANLATEDCCGNLAYNTSTDNCCSGIVICDNCANVCGSQCCNPAFNTCESFMAEGLEYFYCQPICQYCTEEYDSNTNTCIPTGCTADNFVCNCT